MSSNGIQMPENEHTSSQILKAKKTLKSLVVADNDPLKIKLKISKSDGEDLQREENPLNSRRNNSPEKSELQNGEEKPRGKTMDFEEGSDKFVKFGVKPIMKLRSKKESDGEAEIEAEYSSEDGKKRKKSRHAKHVDKSLKRGKISKDAREESLERIEETAKRKTRRSDEASIASEKHSETADERAEISGNCWNCHKDGSVVKCDTCPRVFHLKCVSLPKNSSKDWICPECSLILHAEQMSTRSEAMKSLSLDQLCTLLNFAIERMRNVPESQVFWKPVDPKEFPFYDKYITNPMDFNLLERNIKAKMYGSPQAFLADTKWLLHNSIIFNSNQSRLTSTARFLVKICRQEMAEIENCPDCYLNAHTKKNWFIEVCRKPHILIWARLKGFPFWPAKAMSTDLKTQQVDARFFGAHDKAWVPVKECYLYSKSSPQYFRKKRADLYDAFLEAERYIKKIRQKYGQFCYAPEKTPFVPEVYDQQLQMLIPGYEVDPKSPRKKQKGEKTSSENGLNEKTFQCVGKKFPDNVADNRFNVKRYISDEPGKADRDVCLIGDDYASEEKILNDGLMSPEDEIAKRLEMYDTHKKLDGENGDENSTDLDEEGSLRIPEHGYSRRVDNSDAVRSSSSHNLACERKDASGSGETVEKNSEGRGVVNDGENECAAESSDVTKADDNENGKRGRVATSGEPGDLPKGHSDHCEVSSTSADLRFVENEYQDEASDQNELDASTTENVGETPKENALEKADAPSEKVSFDEKKEELSCRMPKSFVSLSCDQKEKILNEAKLLANIDEMSALGKQKVLNELGLDASNVDIQQLAEENRQILETLSKKRQDQAKDSEAAAVKKENLEQYLTEEGKTGDGFDEGSFLASPRLGSIKVRDINALSKDSGRSPGLGETTAEPMLKIMDLQFFRDLKKMANEPKRKSRKSFDESVQSKKLKLQPVVELIKLESSWNKSAEALNKKLRLSDEVSLLMVKGGNKRKMNSDVVKTDGKKPKSRRARKGMPNRAKGSSSAESSDKNISVISIDTENSAARNDFLKSLRLEENKADEGGTKTVLITTNEKGIKSVDVKKASESMGRKQMKEAAIEAGTNSSHPMESDLVASSPSRLIVASQGSQPNLALAQNNLGQLSLVHLSNLSSGIQTNFVSVANETIGFNASIPTLYASHGFAADSFPVASGPSSHLILAQNLTASLPAQIVSAGNVSINGSKPDVAEPVELSVSSLDSVKSAAGITVKSPATLGLTVPQPSKLSPPVVTSGCAIPLTGEVGAVTAELNKHSMRMAEYMRTTMEEILKDLANQGSLEAKYKLLTFEIEKLQWKHHQEMMELKHHSERSLIELRTSLESDKQKCLEELKIQMESQHRKIISETKRKQWCANCGKEALFYCCWNTSYCDYPCQQQHWPGHLNTCAQLGNNLPLGPGPGSVPASGRGPGCQLQDNFVNNVNNDRNMNGSREGRRSRVQRRMLLFFFRGTRKRRATPC